MVTEWAYEQVCKANEKQVATTCKWMALHDEVVEREALLSAENKRLTVMLEEYVRLDRLGLVGYDKHQPEVPDARCEAIATVSTVPERQKVTENAKKCIGNDPLCPCQDGDPCHYEGPDAWPVSV